MCRPIQKLAAEMLHPSAMSGKAFSWYRLADLFSHALTAEYQSKWSGGQKTVPVNEIYTIFLVGY